VGITSDDFLEFRTFEGWVERWVSLRSSAASRKRRKYISPDVVANLLSAEDQKRKFERVVETARPVWR
jgi:hypothetical protein